MSELMIIYEAYFIVN